MISSGVMGLSVAVSVRSARPKVNRYRSPPSGTSYAGAVADAEHAFALLANGLLQGAWHPEGAGP